MRFSRAASASHRDGEVMLCESCEKFMKTISRGRKSTFSLTELTIKQ
jgi:hypothetical protein